MGKLVMEKEHVEIVKPCTDTWEYRIVVLQNSLEVLLINDTDIGKVTPSILDFYYYYYYFYWMKW